MAVTGGLAGQLAFRLSNLVSGLSGTKRSGLGGDEAGIFIFFPSLQMINI
jgi:hypothetical protein